MTAESDCEEQALQNELVFEDTSVQHKTDDPPEEPDLSAVGKPFLSPCPPRSLSLALPVYTRSQVFTQKQSIAS